MRMRGTAIYKHKHWRHCGDDWIPEPNQIWKAAKKSKIMKAVIHFSIISRGHKSPALNQLSTRTLRKFQCWIHIPVQVLTQHVGRSARYQSAMPGSAAGTDAANRQRRPEKVAAPASVGSHLQDDLTMMNRLARTSSQAMRFLCSYVVMLAARQTSSLAKDWIPTDQTETFLQIMNCTDSLTAQLAGMYHIWQRCTVPADCRVTMKYHIFGLCILQ